MIETRGALSGLYDRRAIVADAGAIEPLQSGEHRTGIEPA
jgi:hypothetical protein